MGPPLPYVGGGNAHPKSGLSEGPWRVQYLPVGFRWVPDQFWAFQIELYTFRQIFFWIFFELFEFFLFTYPVRYPR